MSNFAAERLAREFTKLLARETVRLPIDGVAQHVRKKPIADNRLSYRAGTCDKDAISVKEKCSVAQIESVRQRVENVERVEAATPCGVVRRWRGECQRHGSDFDAEPLKQPIYVYSINVGYRLCIGEQDVLSRGLLSITARQQDDSAAPVNGLKRL
jgi:hypothetical protein